MTLTGDYCVTRDSPASYSQRGVSAHPGRVTRGTGRQREAGDGATTPAAGPLRRTGRGGPMSTPATRAKASAPKVDLDAARPPLERLGFTRAADELDGLLTQAFKEQMAPHHVVDRLLDEKLSYREERRIRTSLTLSALRRSRPPKLPGALANHFRQTNQNVLDVQSILYISQ